MENEHEELRELTFGETLGKSISLCFNNIGPVLLITVIFGLAVLIPMAIPFKLNFQNFYALADSTNPQSFSEVFNLMTWFMPIYLLFGLGISLYMVYIYRFFMAKYTGRTFNYKKEIGIAFRKFLPMIGISLLYGLIVMGGSILFIIPGIIFSYGFILAPLLKAEGQYKGTEELKASWNLMKGYKLTYFALYFVISLIVTMVFYGVLFAIGAVAAILLAVLAEQSTIAFALISTGTAIVTLVLTALIYPIFFSMNVVVLYNRKIVVEGYSVEHSTEEYLNEDIELD